ncbi:hypothetical protein G6F22_016599 [Rhizopus arrhizus]|nr:hypothetical protein G6F22_016599 [Rhizopus arrhizus]
MTSRLFQARAALTDAKTGMEGGLEAARDESLAQADALLKQAGASLARLRANPDASAQGGPLFEQVLKAYTAFAEQTLVPMQKAIQGWNGIEVNRLVDKVLPASGAAYVKQADAYQTYSREQGQAAVAGASQTLERVILVAAGVLGVVLLLGVEFFGETSKGATRWLNLGVTRIQPSEMMKIAVPMMLAWYFQRHEGAVRIRDFLAAAAMLAAPFGLIVLQPDLGTALLVCWCR